MQREEDFSHLGDKQRRQAPVVELSATKVDFGDVAAGTGAVERTLQVKNTGRHALKLRRLFVPGGEGITATCDQAEIKRGHTATVTLRLDPSRRRGTVVNTSLNVITNDPYTPQSLVRLVGIVH